MEKSILNLSIYSILAVILLFCWQCKPETDLRTKETKEYLKSRYDLVPDKNTAKIYIINDLGCGNCILSLSEFVKQKVNGEHAFIIIHSRGNNVDLNGFEDKKRKNSRILINHQLINDKNDPFYHSGVIYMNEDKVDTIVNLWGENIAGQLEYIFDREIQK